jgi:hypothetical protein
VNETERGAGENSEITLDLLSRTAIAMTGLTKYAHRSEIEMIPKAYQFLRCCQTELEGAPKRIAISNVLYDARTQEMANWKDIKDITGQSRSEKLIKFFKANYRWRKTIVLKGRDPSQQTPSRLTPADDDPIWKGSLKKITIAKAALPYLKAEFQEWTE